MIKDKILEMADGKSYYVLESIEYENKMYALTLECDLEKDEVNTDDYLVMEISINGDELNIEHIVDDNVAVVVSARLLNKVKNS